jgi:hypothetical protein
MVPKRVVQREPNRAERRSAARSSQPAGRTPTKQEPVPRETSVIPTIRRRPELSTEKDDVVRFANVLPELEADKLYSGKVTTSRLISTPNKKERYKISIVESESGCEFTFTEPYPLKPEYSAVAELFSNNGLLTRLSSLEDCKVDFSIWLNEGIDGNVYKNLANIVLLHDNETENDDDDEVPEKSSKRYSEPQNMILDDEEEEIDTDDFSEMFNEEES